MNVPIRRGAAGGRGRFEAAVAGFPEPAVRASIRVAGRQGAFQSGLSFPGRGRCVQSYVSAVPVRPPLPSTRQTGLLDEARREAASGWKAFWL